MMDEVLRRFEEKFVPCPMSGCWIWIGATNNRGYGQFGFGDHGHETAHRVAYQLYIGPIPEGMHVLHYCDVRCCVNYDHLHLGTHQDNMREKVERGNHPIGEATVYSKLTEADVLAIRMDTRLHRDIAADYGVLRQTIGDIKRRRSWKHLL